MLSPVSRHEKVASLAARLTVGESAAWLKAGAWTRRCLCVFGLTSRSVSQPQPIIDPGVQTWSPDSLPKCRFSASVFLSDGAGH